MAKDGHAVVVRMRPTILLAVDFSPASSIALDTCKAIAPGLGASVVLVHAMLEPGSAQVRRQAEEWSKTLAEAGVPVEVALHPGIPAEVILREAKRRDVALILMGSAGESGIRGWVLGSVAKTVLHKSKTPVLITPLRMRKTPRAPAPAKVIVCAVDFSSDAEVACEAAGRLANDLGYGLRLVHVIDAFPYSDPKLHLAPEVLAREEEAAAAGLALLSQQVAKHGVNAVPVVHLGPAAAAIVADAKASNAAFIVAGTHGKSKVRKLLLGSVAQSIVQTADRPVLVVPGP